MTAIQYIHKRCWLMSGQVRIWTAASVSKVLLKSFNIGLICLLLRGIYNKSNRLGHLLKNLKRQKLACQVILYLYTHASMTLCWLKYFYWNLRERCITFSVSNNLLNGREVKFRVGPSLQSVGSLYFEIFSLSDIEILDTNNIAQSCHVNIRTNSLVRKNYMFLTFALHRGQNTNKYFPVSLLTEKLLQNSFSKQMSCYIVMRMKIRYKNIRIK